MPHVGFPQSFCRGAIARRDITPPPGIYHRMWGAATHERATGIHRPLFATALALAPASASGAADDPRAAYVLLAIDHCLLWNDELDALVEAICRAARIERAGLHVTCSHTHAAGLMDRSRANLPGGELIGPYLDVLAQRAGEAVCEALASLRPLRIMYGAGCCALARYRDFWDAENKQFVCGFHPEGPTDDTVLVARLSDERSTTVATLVNYACHPTTLAWDNTLVSPDYIGAMREVVERETRAPCLFLQGASGDLGPREGYVGDVAVADRNGRELGYAALAALVSLPEPGQRFEYAGPVVSGATLGTWKYVPLPPDELAAKLRWHAERFAVDLPYRADLPTRQETETQLAAWQAAADAAQATGDAARARDAGAQAERMLRQLARLRSLPAGKCVPLAASLLQLGDAFWITLAGEHYHLMQRALRERFRGHPIIVATVTDGWLPGYVPTAETYGKGIYQETIAIVAPGSLDHAIKSIGDRIGARLGEGPCAAS